MYSEGMKACWLLLLVITVAVRVDCDVNDIPLIQWDADCDDYEVTASRGSPRLVNIHLQYSTVTECRYLCTRWPHCGGFEWFEPNNLCGTFNINNDIIDRYLSPNWYRDSDGYGTWYSKNCTYDLGESDLSCNTYISKGYDKYPGDKWLITYTDYFIPELTASQCQKWCTLYTGCRSVTYRLYEDNRGQCHLYNTTVQDLQVDTGLDSDLFNVYRGSDLAIYDRYCAGGTPYAPGVPNQSSGTRPRRSAWGVTVTAVLIMFGSWQP